MPNPLRVLHLEDRPRDAEVIRHKLVAEGVSCDIILVSTQDEFKAALMRESFDLVLCDYNLPGYDGISALTCAQHTQPDVPVILISGTVDDEEAVRCLHLGATDYILKDRLERLASAVERAIQEAKTRRTRRLTEENLRQSELLNRNLVEHLPQRVFVKDLNCNYVFCNSIYARDLGIAPTQIVGKDDFAFFSRELAEKYRADDRRVMTDGKTKVLDERYMVAGDERWVRTVKVPYRDGQGEIIGVVGLFEDISERKRVDAQRERLAALVDASPDFIGYADPRTAQIKYINKGGRKMCGIGEDEDIGKIKISDVYPAWMNQRLTEVVLPAAVRDGLWQGDGAFLHRDGREIPISMTLLAHRSADGDVDFFYTVSHDITERKEAEIALQQLAAIVEAADDAIVSKTLDGTVLTWNPAAERLFGYRADEIVGRSIAVIIPEDRQDEEPGLLKRIAAGERIAHYESVRTRKDGSTFDVSLSVSPVRDQLGVIIGASKIARDITNQKKAEAELKRLTDDLQLQRLRVFKATIRTVQDIVNNMLNSFQLFRLEGQGQLPTEMLTLVDQMVHEASVKLKTLGDLDVVNEKEMAIGTGIDYPGAGS
jgi:PAS domain S-box-containing protein